LKSIILIIFIIFIPVQTISLLLCLLLCKGIRCTESRKNLGLNGYYLLFHFMIFRSQAVNLLSAVNAQVAAIFYQSLKYNYKAADSAKQFISSARRQQQSL
jgi:hypothetical protein